ncbi:death domain-containing protein 1 isoform X1 [Takifugu rubripes]|uniref:death domain-containing protein 1 isoform X1 n=1 Tax=Takifugu rubripes TaxID=31033 RepID=UPI001145DD7E|nr:death domain-containing protein 1 isoform X1 [Takifugu rubripes]
MEEEEFPKDARQEEALLGRLVEAVRGLKALRSLRDRRQEVAAEGGCPAGEEGGGGAGDGGGGFFGDANVPDGHPLKGSIKYSDSDSDSGGKGDEEERIRKLLHSLRGVGISHSARATSWREALRECVCVLATPPPGGSGQQPVLTGDSGRERHDTLVKILLSVEDDVQNLTDTLARIVAKLNEEILQFHKEEPRDAASPEQHEDHLSEHVHLGPDSNGMSGPLDAQPAADSSSRLEEKGAEPVEDNTHTDVVLQDNQGEDGDLIVGLGCPGVPDVCFVRGPPGLAGALRCEVADALSCLMVRGSEELVSRVVRIQVRDGARLPFPVTVVVPFCGSYRGSYRDVSVKIVDEVGGRSYVTPLATEGTYGGQWGSFAEVRVYRLGLFAVVSCLKRENYTVPTKGLSLKLNMDPRICLNYLPGCFATPVIAQTMIQPLDTTLLSAAKSRTDAYHSVVSTSPVLYLTHPSTQPLRRPLTLTLPCPPNPQKNHGGRHEESRKDQTQEDKSASQGRTLASSVKSQGISEELLVVMGWRDKQWSLLDQVAVRNLQKGLVTFDLMEIFDRLLVLRLRSPLQPSDLSSLAEELEESVRSHAVTLVLQRRPEEPDAVLVAALPSRDLSWELSKLRAQGYAGLPEASSQLSMCDGDQLVLRFGGNVAAAGDQSHQRLTFHAQLHSRVLLRLTHVDPYGNYSSPHYKGTASFYKVTRERADREQLDRPVCKLSLTLPKRPRAVRRQNAARVKSCDEPDSLPDSLLLRLSAELSEEEVARLVPSLRLCRSAAQLVKLRAGESPSAQAFHVLAMWRRGLTAASRRPKTSQLARCLARMGRPDLAGELLLRQPEASRQEAEPPAGPGSRNLPVGEPDGCGALF